MDWQPMTEHKFPWDHTDVLVAVFDKDKPMAVDVFRCAVGEHGAFFPKTSGMLSIHEEGWIPFAWKEDDTPEPDENWSPMMTDYLTGFVE